MSLYTEYDIDLLKKKSDEIRKELEKIKEKSMEPTLEEQKEIQKIIKEYCIEKKRKLYGGFAWNLLIIQKNHVDKIYTDDKVADIDFYSPDPITDWYNICNLLHKKGFKYVLGEEAQHQETYSVKVNRIVFCDISYVPKNIYSRIPFIEIGGLQCVHPSFATIDYFRMSTDPIESYWRFFNSGEDLKGFKRFYKLQKYYPLPYNDRPLDMPEIKPKADKALKYIFDYLINKESLIVTGFYAYNYLCHTSNYDHVKIPFYEFISINYRDDALELINYLKEKMPQEKENITFDEYYPFFQFTDYSVDIYINNDIVCRIYSNNKKCIPFQDVPALNFDEKKALKINGNIRLCSYGTILLYFLIDVIKNRVQNDKQMEKFYYQIISHCIQTRNKYFKKYGKTFLDKSIFQEFIVTCAGESMSPEKERMILIEKRKKNKEPLVYRYDPKDEKEAPVFKGFKNSSGNKIKNPKNLRLSEIKHDDNNDDDNDIDDENLQAENKKDSSDKEKINKDNSTENTTDTTDNTSDNTTENKQ
jgi:hypothetical protein